MAIRIKFTKREIERLPPPTDKQRETYLDTDPANSSRREAVPGLQLTVSNAGTKSFVLCRKLKGRTKKITIGRFPGWTVEQARDKAKSVIAEMNKGEDPIAKRRQEKTQGITLKEVLEEYFRVRGHNIANSTQSNYRTAINKHLAKWADLPISSITRDKVAKTHQLISKDSPTAANTSMRILRALFNFANGQYEDAEGRGLYPDNPVSRLTHTRSWNKETRRGNKIRNSDLKSWFSAVLVLRERKDTFAQVASDYLIFLILTGLRRREAASLQTSDINFREGTFTVRNTKNGEPLTLPTSDYTQELLHRRSQSTTNGMIFPSKGSQGHIDDPRRVVSNIRNGSSIHFTLHDLRRTFISIAESLDIPSYALKRLINHSTGGDVTAGYIVMDVERLREPMQKITDFITSQAEL